MGERIVGARFADLFAGTGSYGLEALSRGAAGGWFVERDRTAVTALRGNLVAVEKSAGIPPGAGVVSTADALNWLPPADARIDIIFVDPPFDEIPRLAESLFRRFAGFMRDAEDGLLVFEMPGELDLRSPGWTFLRRIGHGRDQPTCCIYRLES